MIHTCVCCPSLCPGEPRLWERPHVCEGCRLRLGSVLREILDLYATLPEHFERGRANGQRVSGSREPPLPLRVAPLDLSLPALSGSARWAVVHDLHLDQTGYIPVAVVLDQWALDWRDTLSPREHLPVPTVATLVSWLRLRIDPACDRHPAIDEFATAMTQLRHDLRAATDSTRALPEHLDVPCRSCDRMTLYRMPGDDRALCQHPDCGLILYPDDYERWVALLAGFHRPA